MNICPLLTQIPTFQASGCNPPVCLSPFPAVFEISTFCFLLLSEDWEELGETEQRDIEVLGLDGSNDRVQREQDRIHKTHRIIINIVIIHYI